VSETLLDYWREDPLLSEHHEHWHVVYPFAGAPNETLLAIQDHRLWNNRHGELFAYMHSQLLARYAAERLSVGLPPVVPFNDYRAPILEGYNPDIEVMLKGRLTKPGNRLPNTILSDLKRPPFNTRPGAELSAQEKFRDRLRAVVGSPSASNRPTTLSGFAERIEPTDRLATQYFGALHNDGHLLISLHDNDPNAEAGCLFWEALAVRDPIFYRWHAHIDEFFRLFQDSFTPYDFSELPPVEVSELKIMGSSGQQNELKTRLRTRPLRLHDTITIDYLSHEDFEYELALVSKSEQDLAVTVRIFVAPQKHINERAAWIEMDKFRRTLTRNKNIIKRGSKSSSVVRHPVLTAEMLEGTEARSDDSGASLGCRCGWPYTLLVPRGTPEGEDFRFVALITSGTDLSPALVDQNNSSSYCGLRDSDYPDVRAMGYPFDRPFKGQLSDWVDGPGRPPQLGSTLVVIKHISN
jgi:tyrosinase